MNKTLAVVDAIEQRIALVVGAAAVAYSAAAPKELSAKWAAILATAAVVSHVVATKAPADAPAPVAAPTEADVNAELP